MPGSPQDASPPTGGPGEPTPAATLVIHVDRFSRAGANKANVYVDGVRMVNKDGPNAYVVAPGRHMVSAEVNAAGRTYGQADLQVDVPSDGVLNAFYAAPASLTTPGRLALQPVDNAGAGAARAGRGCLIVLLVFILVVVAVMVIAVVGSTSARSGRATTTQTPPATMSSTTGSG